MLQLASIFQSGAVFQQQKTIPVWGKTEPLSMLSAEFCGQKIYGKSSAAGDFMLRFGAVEAGGPFVLKVCNDTTGENIVLEDILIGEVWLASGQSNMAYRLNDSNFAIPIPPEEIPSHPARVQEREFCSSIQNGDKFRFINIPQVASGEVETSFNAKWQYMTADNAPFCSAVGAWFGKYIQEKLNVPVGIILSAWGGTIAEAWTSRSGLMSNPDTVPLVQKWDEMRNQSSCADENAKSNVPVAFSDFADPGNRGFDMGFANLDFDDSQWMPFNVPGSWIRQKIAGNGAIWARKTFYLSAAQAEKDFVVKFGAIDKTDITYCNGVEVGRMGEGLDTSCYNVARNYKIPANLLRVGKNVIAVRAYSFAYDGAFCGRSSDFKLESADGKDCIAINGTWNAVAEVDFGIANTNAMMNYGAGNANTPSILFDSMINPLIPYAMRGVIWYQGESNAKCMADSYMYYAKLKTLINDWRYYWAQGDFPFIQVQLAGWQDADYPVNEFSAWALLRDIQRKLCDDMPNVYMASAVDIGDADDIHPKDKKSVGFRLAVNALYNVYRCRDVVPAGPLYCGCEAENGKMRIKFKYNNGLTLKDDQPMSFVIAGTDLSFKIADKVEIDGDSLLVSSAAVPFPAAVRYAWGSNPANSLYNGAGLPASPFRTDDWHLTD